MALILLLCHFSAPGVRYESDVSGVTHAGHEAMEERVFFCVCCPALALKSGISLLMFLNYNANVFSKRGK